MLAPRLRVRHVQLALLLTLGVASAFGLRPDNTFASQTVVLSARFTPDRLGASTTIHVHTRISSEPGSVPSPVTKINVMLPLGMGLGSLGEEACNPVLLTERGVAGCPTNSIMGHGEVLTELPLGPEFVHTRGKITIFMGTPIDNHTTMVDDVETITPIMAQIIYHTEVLPAPGNPQSAYLSTEIPLIPTLPGAPFASVIDTSTNIGPQGLTYHKRIHGNEVKYQPTGMTVPDRCPRGGFVFGATYNFLDGASIRKHVHVPCPAAAKGTNHRSNGS